jgi:hydroxypyruvate reductase
MSRSDAMTIIKSGLQAASPDNYIRKFMTKNALRCAGKKYKISDYDRIWLVAVGKAADAMAKSTNKILHADGGIIVIPKNYDIEFSNKKFQVIKSGHPTPNDNSVFAAKKIISLLQNADKADLVVFLISGGASALVCAPQGVSLAQKIKTTKVLLECGASISEINAIRKHLSAIKGGKLLESLRCEAASYVMSDVVGDDLGAIGSGLTYCDKTLFLDCLEIVSKYGLGKKIPKPVLAKLKAGAQGKLAETPKKPMIPNQIIATNSDCLDAMARTAKKLGYKTIVYPNVTDDVRLAAKKLLKKFQQTKAQCLVFGGETTVQIHGKGRGGRNQELVLQMISDLPKNTVIASVGTDGIDGNTKHAGAIFDGAVDHNIAKQYLQNNDSSSFFAKYGGLITTGPTHTNLLDVGLILKHL